MFWSNNTIRLFLITFSSTKEMRKSLWWWFKTRGSIFSSILSLMKSIENTLLSISIIKFSMPLKQLSFLFTLPKKLSTRASLAFHLICWMIIVTWPTTQRISWMRSRSSSLAFTDFPMNNLKKRWNLLGPLSSIPTMGDFRLK